jgi:hypothetical protein
VAGFRFVLRRFQLTGLDGRLDLIYINRNRECVGIDVGRYVSLQRTRVGK